MQLKISMKNMKKNLVIKNKIERTFDVTKDDN